MKKGKVMSCLMLLVMLGAFLFSCVASTAATDANYVLVYRGEYFDWYAYQTTWNEYYSYYAAQLNYPDLVYDQLVAILGVNIITRTPDHRLYLLINQQVGGGFATGFISEIGKGPGILIAYDAWVNQYSGSDKWSIDLIPHEETNLFTGNVAGGWPKDWWADDYPSPFPWAIKIVVEQNLGHNDAANASLNSADALTKMFLNFMPTYGANIYSIMMQMLLSDGWSQWFGPNPSLLLSEYVAAYLSLASGSNLASQINTNFLAQNISYQLDPNVVQAICNSRQFLQQIPQNDTRWQSFRQGQYALVLTSTSVTCSPSPVTVGSAATCNATVSGFNPTGTITWSSSSSTGSFSSTSTSLTSGTSSTTYTDTSAGAATITASYSGDPNNAPSSGSTTLTGNNQISDNFSSNSGMWTYEGSAYLDTVDADVVLTQATDWQVGAIWLNQPIDSSFTASFSYRAGGGTGADGIVMMFYKQENYSMGAGGYLGFNGADGLPVPGYGIEADSWWNPEWDPSGGHLALVKDSVANHLVYENDSRVDDNQWHTVIVNVTDSSVMVYVDSGLALSWTGNIDRTYGGFGFSGATGDITNLQMIRNFSISYSTRADIAVVNMTVSKTVVGQGFSLNVSVNAANNGDSAETFNVTTYANQTIIGKMFNVTLASGNSTIVSFIWNTTGFAYGNYTLSAYAWPVPGETNTANNNFMGETVEVTIPGDINGDGTVDIYDAILLSNAFNSQPSSPHWNPNADINGNNIVDLYDAIILAGHFNQHYP